MINKIISHYKVIDKLGEGGMGVLYLAEDLQLNRKAVLKFLPPDMMNDLETNLRFKREAQSAGSLSHPNIVTIYDVGVHENKTFIAMEYVEGKTLRELIKSDELTIEKITDISVQICEGLNEAHSKGITHRDIKPENILIDEKGKVKIVDFGLAKIKNTSRGITKQDSTVGTLKYMSPEQIRNQNVDHRSDIWSFGVILYEMITGKYPFKGEHDASLFYSIINQSPEPLARYKSDIAEGFQRIIDKSLDKDPETRYQHIDELLSDLRREKKESGEHSISKRRVKKSKTKIAIIISAIAFVVLCTAVIIYFFNNKSKIIKPPKHTQLTFDGNVYFYGSDFWLFDQSQISPDGQFTAYVAGKGNEKSIYVRDNSGDHAIEIFKGLREVSSLRWSPSSNEIFFSALLNNSSRNSYIIPKLGGKVQQINYVGWGCWSPDEKLIAGCNVTDEFISLIDIETGQVLKRVELSGSFTQIMAIEWSPDGEEFLFQTHDNNGGIEAIWTIKSDGSHQNKLIQDSNYIYSPKWSVAGNNIYYLRTNGTTQDLMKIVVSSNSSGSTSEIIQAGLQAHGFSLTMNNNKLVYTKINTFSNLWSFTNNQRKNHFQSKKLTDGTSLFKMPVISPDNRDILFINKGNVFEMSIEDELIKQVTYLNSACYSLSWSPDGKAIAFFTGPNLYKLSLATSTLTILKKADNGGQLFWESNKEIFYSDPENRNFYKFDLITHEGRLLVTNDSVGHIFSPRLSPDYSKIAVNWDRTLDSEIAKGIWVLSLNDSSQKLLLKGNIDPMGWSEDNRWIYAIDYDKTPQDILMISTSSGLTKVIYTLPTSKIVLGDIDISQDGKLIVAAISETNSDVWMIENFDQDVE